MEEMAPSAALSLTTRIPVKIWTFGSSPEASIALAFFPRALSSSQPTARGFPASTRRCVRGTECPPHLLTRASSSPDCCSSHANVGADSVARIETSAGSDKLRPAASVSETKRSGVSLIPAWN